MSAITNPRPSSRLTRAERMAELRAAGAGYAAPLYKIGDDVVFAGRASKVVEVSAKYDIVTVESYAGRSMIGVDHPELRPA